MWFGYLNTSVKSLFKGSFRDAFHNLRLFFAPLDYTRTREIPLLLKMAGVKSDKKCRMRILDIASPQALSLMLARLNPGSSITYLNSHDEELAEMENRIRTFSIPNITVLKGDITDAGFTRDLEPFDLVFCCSVLEHIHPEETGDAQAVRNISGLMGNPGRFFFSVPFYTKSFNEYTTAGQVYHVENKDKEKILFQRFYDEDRLFSRIIEPSGLEPADLRFIGERLYHEQDIQKRLGKRLASGRFSMLFGRLFPLAGRIFMTEHTDWKQLKKPYLAFGYLKKEK